MLWRSCVWPWLCHAFLGEFEQFLLSPWVSCFLSEWTPKSEAPTSSVSKSVRKMLLDDLEFIVLSFYFKKGEFQVDEVLSAGNKAKKPKNAEQRSSIDQIVTQMVLPIFMRWSGDLNMAMKTFLFSLPPAREMGAPPYFYNSLLGHLFSDSDSQTSSYSQLLDLTHSFSQSAEA